MHALLNPSCLENAVQLVTKLDGVNGIYLQVIVFLLTFDFSRPLFFSNHFFFKIDTNTSLPFRPAVTSMIFYCLVSLDPLEFKMLKIIVSPARGYFLMQLNSI